MRWGSGVGGNREQGTEEGGNRVKGSLWLGCNGFFILVDKLIKLAERQAAALREIAVRRAELDG